MLSFLTNLDWEKNLKNGKLVAGTIGCLCLGTGIYKYYVSKKKGETIIYCVSGSIVETSLIYQLFLPECLTSDAFKVIKNVSRRHKRILVQLSCIGVGFITLHISSWSILQPKNQNTTNQTNNQNTTNQTNNQNTTNQTNRYTDALFHSGTAITMVNLHFAINNTFKLMDQRKIIKKALQKPEIVGLLIPQKERHLNIDKIGTWLFVALSAAYITRQIYTNNHRQTQNNNNNNNNNQQQNQNNN